MTDRFILEREFAARPEDLFNAWTDATMLSRWFGCSNDQLWNVHAWDVREGGPINVSLDFDGKPYEVRGEFLIVDPPRHLRYRWEADETVDVTFEPRGSGTLLRLEHRWQPTKEDRSMINSGWNNALEQLHHALAHTVTS